MKTTKKLMTLLLMLLACMSASAQDTSIGETCPPQFPGGDAALISFLNENIKYPPKAAQDKVEGKVIVQFLVKKTGKIDDVKVLRSVRKDLDHEAVRVDIYFNFVVLFFTKARHRRSLHINIHVDTELIADDIII